MKAFTDLNQSKVLAEILSIESADAHYVRESTDLNGNPVDGNWSEIKLGNPEKTNYIVQNFSTYEILPCWSLAALLDILPLTIDDDFDYDLKIDMEDKMPRYVVFGDCYHTSFPWDFEKDTLIDNIVESIIWLNNNNYFEL